MRFNIIPPFGYTLIRADGVEHNRIRKDMIPHGMTDIVEDGRHFIATGDRDQDNFAVYREGHQTFVYVSG